MKFRLSRLILPFLVAFPFHSCEKEAATKATNQISFIVDNLAPDEQEEVQTKAFAVLDGASSSLAVKSYLGGELYFTDSVSVKISNSSATWTPSETRYWPESGEPLQFFAWPQGQFAANPTTKPLDSSISFTYSVPTTIQAQKDLLVGHYVGASSDGPAKISLHHPLASVKLVMGGNTSGYTIKTIKLVGLYTSGTCTMKFPKNGSADCSWSGSGASTGFSIGDVTSLAPGSMNGLVDKNWGSFFVIPQKFASDSGAAIVLSISRTGSGSDEFRFSLAGASFEAGKSYTYVINVSPAKDLSNPESANCYIIPASTGYYKFKAVKGCSATSVGTVSSVSVVWETRNTTSAPTKGSIVTNVAYDSSTKYIYFNSTSTTAGNALIAAKDANGNILWSWHIWKAATPSNVTYYKSDGSSAGTLMDRNLGALNATAGNNLSAGLLYQWGRKDPFMGPAALRSASSHMKLTGTAMKVVKVTASGVLSGGNASAYATKNPTAYITGASVNDWYANTRANQNDKLWNTTKTVNDPCPPGYRVPSGSFWYSAFGKTSSSSEIKGASTMKGKGLAPNPTSATSSNIKGLSYSTSNGSGTKAWFPFTGILLNGPTKDASTPAGCSLWTAATNGNNPGFKSSGGDLATLATCLDINCSSSSNSSWTVNTRWASARYTASGVRCQKATIIPGTDKIGTEDGSY